MDNITTTTDLALDIYTAMYNDCRKYSTGGWEPAFGLRLLRERDPRKVGAPLPNSVQCPDIIPQEMWEELDGASALSLPSYIPESADELEHCGELDDIEDRINSLFATYLPDTDDYIALIRGDSVAKGWDDDDVVIASPRIAKLYKVRDLVRALWDDNETMQGIYAAPAGWDDEDEGEAKIYDAHKVPTDAADLWEVGYRYAPWLRTWVKGSLEDAMQAADERAEYSRKDLIIVNTATREQWQREWTGEEDPYGDDIIKVKGYNVPNAAYLDWEQTDDEDEEWKEVHFLNLTTDERAQFMAGWEEAGGYMGDVDSPMPWSQPWTFAPQADLKGRTPKEWGKNWWEQNREEINKSLEA